ncbi:MAG TPA: hypothetical protein VK816_00980 [Jatrophihabitantaceae bacterium]|jgi:hypothetical protein|nr:hypothetical protein [Jatrophihabitantaceae bacterium]
MFLSSDSIAFIDSGQVKPLHAGKHGRLGRLKDGVKSEEHQGRQHDRPWYLVRLQVTAQLVGDLPNEHDLVLEPCGGYRKSGV